MNNVNNAAVTTSDKSSWNIVENVGGAISGFGFGRYVVPYLPTTAAKVTAASMHVGACFLLAGPVGAFVGACSLGAGTYYGVGDRQIAALDAILDGIKQMQKELDNHKKRAEILSEMQKLDKKIAPFTVQLNKPHCRPGSQFYRSVTNQIKKLTDQKTALEAKLATMTE